MVFITAHAIQRYRERVADVANVVDVILAAEPIINRAAEIGCRTVILGNGARLKLKGDVVCTVIGKRGY